ncbi:MAG: hypothetical protein JWQ18_2094 [Conexibacter sp.]|nr:hypothetical protein [Conexibacter sp.]
MSDVVASLGALVELEQHPRQPLDQLSFGIEQYAILTDGRRIVLGLDRPRGWSQSLLAVGHSGPPLDPWTSVTAADLVDSARQHVIPDDDEDPEPLPWDAVVASFAEHDIAVTADELKPLPHDVVLSDAIHALLAAAFAGWGADVEVEEDGDALRFTAEAFARLGDRRRVALDRRAFDVEVSSGDRAFGAWPLVGGAERLREDVRALWWGAGIPRRGSPSGCASRASRWRRRRWRSPSSWCPSARRSRRGSATRTPTRPGACCGATRRPARAPSAARRARRR